MDPELAAPATSRRGLIGALGAAGLAGAAALGIARPVSATTPPTSPPESTAPPEPPSSPTASDKELLRAAMELELSARDLYNEAIGAGLSGVAAEVATVFAANHAAYADKIAGTSGFSANTRNDEVFDEHQSAFATGDVKAFAEAAATLENTAAATHTALLEEFESIRARQLSASILVVEARMATVLSDLGGLASDLDDVFAPDAKALVLTGGGTR